MLGATHTGQKLARPLASLAAESPSNHSSSLVGRSLQLGPVQFLPTCCPYLSKELGHTQVFPSSGLLTRFTSASQESVGVV